MSLQKKAIKVTTVLRSMLIRENIRKGRGRGRIKQEFYRKKIAMPSNIDELIDMANTEV